MPADVSDVNTIAEARRRIGESFNLPASRVGLVTSDGRALSDLDPIDAFRVHTLTVLLQRRELIPEDFRHLTPVDDHLQRVAMQHAILGEGSFGRVWRALNINGDVGKAYAVKEVETRNAIMRGLFQRECTFAERISDSPHPFLVGVLLVMLEANVSAIVMELCQNGNWADRIRECKRDARQRGNNFQPQPQTRLWLGQTFLALEHLHVNVDMLYRALKPENVVFSREGYAKLTDFGEGHDGTNRGPGPTQRGYPHGSPGYAAPEFFNASGQDERTDFYSLGVLMFVALTGGRTDQDYPCPPMGPGVTMDPFQRHRDDWRFMRSYLEEPQRHNALPLEDVDDRELVSQLTAFDLLARPRVQEVRQSAFMQRLGLPEPDATGAQLEQWAVAAAAA